MPKHKRGAPTNATPLIPPSGEDRPPTETFDDKVRLAQITSQLASKVEVKKALLGAVLAIVAAVAISYLTTRSALKASRVVGGQYEVTLYEYAEDGTPRRNPDGTLVGRAQAIIPIEFGGVFDKPPRVIVSINGVDAWGDANTRVHAFAGANATKDRSDIVVKTWGNSVVYTVQVSWVAFADVDARH